MAKCVLTLLVFLTALSAQAAQPTRPPEQGYGCVWKPFESPELGIRLLVQDCIDPNIHYEFSAKDGWLEEHRPSDPVTFGPSQIVRVLSKPADQPIVSAIQEQFVATLTDKGGQGELQGPPVQKCRGQREG
jgi:hypothetical protein